MSEPALDLAIIGGGPAALSAAIYAARAGLNTKVFEKQSFGGALTEVSNLANYPGFNGSGQELSDSLKAQAKSAGAQIEYGTCTRVVKNVEQPSFDGRGGGTAEPERRDPVTTGVADASRERMAASVLTAIIDDATVQARAVLIATGSEPVKLDLDTDKPISYCALCDAPLYKNKKVLVIGGGNAAVGEATYLASIASHVTLINRSPLRAEPALQNKLRSLANVEIHENTQPTPEFLDAADGIFVFIGKRPATSFVPSEILDDDGYIQTDDNFMTTIPGLFAAGDVRSGAIRQAIVASAEGASAAISVTDYLKRLR